MHIDFHVLFIMFTFSQNDNRYSVDLFKKQHTQCMHNVQASAPRALLYFLTPLMSYLIFPFSYLWFLVQWISVVFEFFINCSVLICGNHKFCEDTCNSKDGFVCSMNSVRPQKTQVQLKSVLLLVIEFFCFFLSRGLRMSKKWVWQLTMLSVGRSSQDTPKNGRSVELRS